MPRTAKILTANGNAQIDTAQSKFGGASGLFDGTGDYLSIPDSDDFSFGAGDFTIDYWIRYNSAANSLHYFKWGSPQREIQIYYTSADNLLHFGYSTDGSNETDISKTWIVSANTWYHIAFVRNGADLKFYVNGTQIGTTHNIGTATIYNSTAPLYLGGGFSGYEVNGWMDEIRISKGIARWTANFTPETSAYSCGDDGNIVLLAHCDGTDASTTFTDDNSACVAVATWIPKIIMY